MISAYLPLVCTGLADSAGNVSISISSGAVSQKANVASFSITGGATVTKTISGLTAYKPVYIVLQGTGDTVAEYYVTSGTAINASDTHYFSYVPKNCANWVCVIPNSTSLVLTFKSISNTNKASAKFIAYQ